MLVGDEQQILDKTGTLTRGQLSVQSILAVDTDYSEIDILQLAASVHEQTTAAERQTTFNDMIKIALESVLLGDKE